MYLMLENEVFQFFIEVISGHMNNLIIMINFSVLLDTDISLWNTYNIVGITPHCICRIFHIWGGSYEPSLCINDILISIHSIVRHYTSVGFQYITLALFKKNNNQGQDVSIPMEQSWVVIMTSYT